MTPEELRIEIVSGIDKLLGLGHWLVGDAQRKLLTAERKFWMAPDAPLDKLLTLYQEK